MTDLADPFGGPAPEPVPLRAGVHGAMSSSREAIGDRMAVVCRLDAELRSGAISSDDGVTLANAADYALAEHIPLVVYLASSGADVTDGVAALHGWGLAARAVVRCSGVVPTIVVVHGPAVSGTALLLGLADIVIMTADAYAFVSGPHMVRQFTGEPVTRQTLGGASALARNAGVPSLVVADLETAEVAVEDVLAFLPDSTDDEPPRIPYDDPLDRETPEAADLIPDSPTGSYDVRDVIRTFVDDGELLELRGQWAGNIVTAFAYVGGRPIGILANQPSNVAGTLDIPASQKGARFVAMCDAFNIPLVTLVDTPGFYPGKDLEWRGMIRHGAQMAFAYCRATVPRVCLTLRKSYGGAYIVMDSKRIGNDLSIAWPSAEIAVMGAKGAVEILHRKATPDERVELEAAYEERLLNPYVAAERGFIDAVIDPIETRQVIASALEALVSKREHLPPRGHDNTPL
jgi:acetyl-CoA carboxylase carboxyltransferase component